jgi:hypothetical protein
MRLRTAAFTLVGALIGIPWAVAHPPYEGTPRVLTARNGDIQVVKSYIDGIIGTDPAKVIVRSRGTVLAETGYYRDASVACHRRRCFIAAAHSPFFIVPERLWILEETSLRPVESFWVRGVGTAVHLSNHLFGYALALAFLLLAVTAILRSVRANDEGSGAGCLAGLVALAACGMLLLWLYTVVMLTELSLVWALLFAGAFIGMRAAAIR